VTRVLVLGAAGMLGHKLVQRLAREHDVTGTLRSPAPDTPAARTALERAHLVRDVDIERDDDLLRVFEAARASVVVNAVGVIKQIPEAHDARTSIAINALLPHRVAALAQQSGARLIHFSTDCVFAGRQGPYKESDPADAEDLYGRTKLLGEPDGEHCLTLRSSIVGRELRRGSSLVEWLISNRGGRVSGYAHALYTGMTTLVMSELVARLIAEHASLHGVWQVAAQAISKYELLRLVNRHYALGIEIERDESFLCDRRLDGSRFAAATGWHAPDWDAMIAAMRADPTPYA
jgi:dTDP-4-dehydrorhamnose reductase